MLDNELIRFALLALSGMSFLIFAARVIFDWQRDKLVGARGQEMDGNKEPAKGDLHTVENPSSYEDRVLTLSADDPQTDEASVAQLGYASQVETVFEQSQDDLTKIEGIGPKTEELLNQAGVYSYAKLARVKPLRLKALLDKAGGTFRMHDPSSWPQQAELASIGDWKKLIHLQDRLNAGVSRSKTKTADHHVKSSLDITPAQPTTKNRRKFIH